MSTPSLSHFLASRAYNNAWANHRLLAACARLNAAEFSAKRTGFFPSIRATLNHILAVDCFYIDALEQEALGDGVHSRPPAAFNEQTALETCPELQLAQRAADARLIAYCLALDDASLTRMVRITRPTGFQYEPRLRLLAHVFDHQIHHRGQAHAMLSGTSVSPPQLDEFFCVSDEPMRRDDFAELGFTEAMIWP